MGSHMLINTDYSHFHYTELTSTNDKLIQMLNNNSASEGTFITADIQTKGRGKFKNSWISPEGNLYISTVVEKTGLSSQLPFLAAIAVGEALGIKEIRYKWPNDIIINNKKLGGVLLEAFGSYVIIGIGINMLTAPLKNSTSLKEIGVVMQRAVLLEKLINLFHYYKNILYSKGFDQIRNLWMKNVPQSTIKVVQNDKIITGKFVEIDENGNLILIDNLAQQHCINTGNIFI